MFGKRTMSFGGFTRFHSLSDAYKIQASLLSGSPFFPLKLRFIHNNILGCVSIYNQPIRNTYVDW